MQTIEQFVTEQSIALIEETCAAVGRPLNYAAIDELFLASPTPEIKAVISGPFEVWVFVNGGTTFFSKKFSSWDEVSQFVPNSVKEEAISYRQYIDRAEINIGCECGCGGDAENVSLYNFGTWLESR